MLGERLQPTRAPLTPGLHAPRTERGGPPYEPTGETISSPYSKWSPTPVYDPTVHVEPRADHRAGNSSGNPHVEIIIYSHNPYDPTADLLRR